MSTPPPLPPRRIVQPIRAVDEERGARDLLLRRFNREIRHVRATDSATPGSRPYDVRTSSAQALSAEKLRSNIERVVLYSKQLNRGFQRVAEVREWTDWRSGVLGAVYFVAWSKDCLAIALALASAILLLSPYSRALLFPPIPTNFTTTTKSVPSPTEARATEGETAVMTEGEQADLDATTMTAELQEVYSHGETSDEIPIEVVMDAEEIPATPAIDDTAVPKRPSKLLPIQVIAGDLADSFELWANAFNSDSTAPRRLALIILPVGLALTCLPTRLLIKAITFAVGVVVFGKPLLSRAGDALERTYGPKWKEMLELRNSLLIDSKTNAQTTLALLRASELRNQPLPPPAPLSAPTTPPSEPISPTTTGASTRAEATPTRSGTAKLRLGTAMRLASRGFEQSAGIISGQKKMDWENLSQLAIDKLRTTTGSDLPGLLSYAVPASSASSDTSSISFYAHHKAKPGHLLLRPPSRNDIESSWRVGFVSISGASAFAPFEIPVNSIRGLSKVAALGWKSRLAAGWVVGAELGTGIELVNEEGEKFIFTSVLRRDEVFNRVIALVQGVEWESC